jgi:hypothetical protein
MPKKNQSAGDAPAVNLAEMTKEQLLEFAAEKSVTVDAVMEKEEIIQALIEADPSLSAGPPASGEPPQGDSAGDETPEETAPASGEPAKGTIRTIKGVESVYVGTGWVPTVRENIEDGKPVKIVSKKRAGQTIFARSGKPITFNAEGEAVVSAVDGQYLASIAIDGKPEFEVEE